MISPLAGRSGKMWRNVSPICGDSRVSRISATSKPFCPFAPAKHNGTLPLPSVGSFERETKPYLSLFRSTLGQVSTPSPSTMADSRSARESLVAPRRLRVETPHLKGDSNKSSSSGWVSERFRVAMRIANSERSAKNSLWSPENLFTTVDSTGLSVSGTMCSSSPSS